MKNHFKPSQWKFGNMNKNKKDNITNETFLEKYINIFSNILSKNNKNLVEYVESETSGTDSQLNNLPDSITPLHVNDSFLSAENKDFKKTVILSDINAMDKSYLNKILAKDELLNNFRKQSGIFIRLQESKQENTMDTKRVLNPLVQINVHGYSISQIDQVIQRIKQLLEFDKKSVTFKTQAKNNLLNNLAKKKIGNNCYICNGRGHDYKICYYESSKNKKIRARNNYKREISKLNEDKASTIILRNSIYRKKYLSFLESAYNFSYRQKLITNVIPYQISTAINYMFFWNIKAKITKADLYSKIIQFGRVKTLKNFRKKSSLDESRFLIVIYRQKKSAFLVYKTLDQLFFKGRALMVNIKYI